MQNKLKHRKFVIVQPPKVRL